MRGSRGMGSRSMMSGQKLMGPRSILPRGVSISTVRKILGQAEEKGKTDYRKEQVERCGKVDAQ